MEKMVPGMHCGGKNVSGNRAAGTHSKQIIGSHWNGIWAHVKTLDYKGDFG